MFLSCIHGLPFFLLVVDVLVRRRFNVMRGGTPDVAELMDLQGVLPAVRIWPITHKGDV